MWLRFSCWHSRRAAGCALHVPISIGIHAHAQEKLPQPNSTTETALDIPIEGLVFLVTLGEASVGAVFGVTVMVSMMGDE